MPLDLELFGQFNRSRGTNTAIIQIPEPLTEKFRNRQPEATASPSPPTSSEGVEAVSDGTAMKEAGGGVEDEEEVLRLKAENSALNRLLEALFVRPASGPASIQVYTVRKVLADFSVSDG